MSHSSETIHKLIQRAFSARDNAYAPYSKFRVGSALLTDNGDMITGCNVENASYGGSICAERTAVTKGISEGHKRFASVVVVSDVPSPTVSPCGMCRQVLNEFMAKTAKVYMVSSTYPFSSDTAPPQALEDPDMVKVMTMEELLPMGFGPEQMSG